MVEPTAATAGSASSTSTTARWRSAMAAKEISGPAMVTPSIRPVSWVGKKPFGTTVYSQMVRPMVAKVTNSMSQR